MRRCGLCGLAVPQSQEAPPVYGTSGNLGVDDRVLPAVE